MTATVALWATGSAAISAAALAPPPRRPLPVVVVELVDEGLYFSDSPYRDLSEGIEAEPRLASEVTFSRSVSCPIWNRGRARAGIGAIELQNRDGALDALLLGAPLGAGVRIWIGTDETPWAEMLQVARVAVDQPRSVGEDLIRLPVLDHAAELARPIQTSTYTSGTLDGRSRPVLLGQSWNIAALLSDYTASAWSIADQSVTVLAVRDNGAALTFTSQWAAYDVGEHHGFDLKQASVGRITADARAGTFGGHQGRSLPGIVGALVQGRMGWSSSDIDYTGLAALATELGSPWFGFATADAINADRLLDLIASSFLGWWSVGLDGVLRMDRLRLPSGTPVLVIDEHVLSGDVEIELDTMPGLSDVVLTQKNWHVHAASELAASVRDGALGAMYQEPYRRRVTFPVHDVYARARGADLASRETLFSGDSDGAAEAARREELTEVPMFWYRCPCELSPEGAATLQGGQVVELRLPASARVLVDDEWVLAGRYGLDEGRLLNVIGVDGKIGEGQVELVLWGAGVESA